MKFDNNIKLSLILYVIICFAIYYIKPPFIFDNQGNFKQFGLTRDKTIYPFWLVGLIIGIVIYLLVIIRNNDFI